MFSKKPRKEEKLLFNQNLETSRREKYNFSPTRQINSSIAAASACFYSTFNFSFATWK